MPALEPNAHSRLPQGDGRLARRPILNINVKGNNAAERQTSAWVDTLEKPVALSESACSRSPALSEQAACAHLRAPPTPYEKITGLATARVLMLPSAWAVISMPFIVSVFDCIVFVDLVDVLLLGKRRAVG